MLVLINHINKAAVLTDLFTVINCVGSKTVVFIVFPKQFFTIFFASSLVGMFFTL